MTRLSNLLDLSEKQTRIRIISQRIAIEKFYINLPIVEVCQSF